MWNCSQRSSAASTSSSQQRVEDSQNVDLDTTSGQGTQRRFGNREELQRAICTLEETRKRESIVPLTSSSNIEEVKDAVEMMDRNYADNLTGRDYRLDGELFLSAISLCNQRLNDAARNELGKKFDVQLMAEKLNQRLDELEKNESTTQDSMRRHGRPDHLACWGSKSSRSLYAWTEPKLRRWALHGVTSLENDDGNEDTNNPRTSSTKEDRFQQEVKANAHEMSASGRVVRNSLHTWAEIGRQTHRQVLRQPPFISTAASFLDTSDVVLQRPKSRVSVVPRVRHVPVVDEAVKLKPKTAADIAISDPDYDNAVAKQLERVRACLRGAWKQLNVNTIDFFFFVIDNTSFARTVENMFYVSFLVRDGFCNLDMDHSGVLRLGFIEPEMRIRMATLDRTRLPMHQGSVSLEHGQWEKLVEFYTAQVVDFRPWISKQRAVEGIQDTQDPGWLDNAANATQSAR